MRIITRCHRRWLQRHPARREFLAVRRAVTRLEELEARVLLSGIPLTASSTAGSTYYQLPLSFAANQGQAAPEVGYVARGHGYSLLLTASTAALELQSTSSTGTMSTALSMQVVGASSEASSTALNPLPGVVNDFTGNDPSQWHTNIATYGTVSYQNVYPGVNLDYYGNQGELEYDFTVAPGASPGVIALSFQGATSVSLDSAGNLVLATPAGNLTEHAPVVYQNVNGVRQSVTGSFVLQGNGDIGFQVGTYDTSLPLIIDPTLSYSTFLGGDFSSDAFAVAVDSQGNAYVTGDTGADTFPTTTGAYNRLLNGSGSPGNTVTDVFVTKFSPSGTLVYSTFIGGTTDDHGTGIAIDSQGNAYVTGWTDSGDFPTTPGAFQATASFGENGFVTKLNPSGTALVYSTYLQGSSDDQPHAIAVDSQGFAYIAGDTFSNDFPTKNPIQGQNNGNDEAFVTKLNQAGTGLVYSTYLGGSQSDGASGIAVDSANEAIVVGYTDSIDFATTPNAFQPNRGGDPTQNVTNTFVTKINAAGSAFVYSTYLGGSVGALNNLSSGGPAVATDSAGAAYVTGDTADPDFPTTINAAEQTKNFTDTYGLFDAFVAKFNPAGGLDYSTFLSGGGLNASSAGRAIAVDSQGNAFVTGFTEDTSTPFPLDFPIQTTPGQPASYTKPGLTDAFVTEVSPDGSHFLYSSYLGGQTDDLGYGLGIDGNDNVYVVGTTNSIAAAGAGTPSTFPTLNAINSTPPNAAFGEVDGFVARVNLLEPGAGTFYFPYETYETTEAGKFVTVTVARRDGDSTAASINYSTSNGTAKNGTNYQTVSGTLNFPVGVHEKSFNVPVLDDGVNDNTPYLVVDLTLSSPTAGAVLDNTASTANVHIYDIETTSTNNDLWDNAIPLAGASPSATGSNVNATTNQGFNGGDPNDIYDFPVTDGKSTTSPKNDGGASVWWIWSPPVTEVATVDTFGSDFDTMVTVFGPNNHVVQNDDALGRTDGASAVTFLAEAGFTYRFCVQGYDFGGGAATGNIVLHINGQPSAGSLQFGDQTYDTYEQAGSIVIPVTRTGGSFGAVSVVVSTGGGTAVPGVDYTSVNTTLNWANGDTSTKDVVIPILNSGASGNSPTFNVNLSKVTGSASIGNPSSIPIVIFQTAVSSTSVQFQLAQFTVNENAGSVAIPVSRSIGSDFVTISVQASTSNGTAVVGTDYGAVTQTLIWGDNDTATKYLVIPIIDRGLTSGTKTVNLTLSTPRGGGALGSPSTAVLTIQDNDGSASPAGSLTFGTSTFSGNENSGNVTVPVMRTGGSTGPVSVIVSTSDGTAVAGLDYTAQFQTLNWASGDTSAKDITIPVTDRGLTSGLKTLGLTLTYATGGAVLASPSTAVLTINENDAPVAGAISLGAATYNVNENGGSISIPVSRTGGSAGVVSVQFSTGGGTATAGTDYTAVNQTVSWSNGQTNTQNIVIPILDPHLTSGSKTVNIALSGPTGGATLGSPSSAVLTIADNDSAGSIQLGSATFSVNENGGSIQIPVTRTGGTAGAVSVQFATGGGTATAGTDYASVNQTVSWTDGQSNTQNITIPILDAHLTSGSKTLNITLSSPAGNATLGTPNTAVLTIQDNDSAGSIQLGAATFSVNESGGSISIPVSRTGGTTGAVSVQFATGGGTATAGTDYTSVNQTVSWTDGQSNTQSITIPILDAHLTSGSKTVNITLSNPTGTATLGTPNTAVLTILDNDAPAGTIELGSATFSVNENGGSVSIPVSRTNGTAGAVSVQFTTGGGTATAGTDYTAVNQTVSWTDGQSNTQSITIPILDAHLIGGSKTVNITLASPTGNATLGTPNTAVLTIQDNDSAGSIQLGAATFSVNESGGSISIPVSRTGGSTGAVSVQFATGGGTATAGMDYTSVNQTLSWTDGQSNSQNVTIPILDPHLTSGSKTVNITLSNPTGSATLGAPNTAVLTILDNDTPAGTIGLGAATFSVNENGGSISIPVSRASGSSGAVSVQFSTGGGTATAGTDYTAVNQTITWSSGDSSSKTVNIPIIDRQLTSGSFDFNVTISSPTGGALLGIPASATVTINDNDVPVPTAPSAPQLAPQSDTGLVNNMPGLTKDNGSANAPLTLTVGGVNPANGFVQLYDGNVPLGSQVPAVGGTATITLSGLAQPLSDGVHEISATVAATLGGTQSAASTSTTITIQTSLRVLSISPNPGTNVLTSLANNQIVITFNHPLAGLVADDPSTDSLTHPSSFRSNPFAVMLLPSGPDGQVVNIPQTGSLWTAPSGYDSGNLPVPATLLYQVNSANGTSTITLTPDQPLASDVYLVSVNGLLNDLAGNPLANQNGTIGTVFENFIYRPTPINASPLRVTSITTEDGMVPITNGAAIAQPDTIGIAFNKPLDVWQANSSTVHLFANGALQSSVAAYSPSTDTIYLTPEVRLSPGTTYTIAVDGTLSDDQNFPAPGNSLEQASITNFTVTGPGVSAGGGSGSLTVTATNPPSGAGFVNGLGYGSVTFNEGITLSANSVGRFSAMLIPQTGGVTTGAFAGVPYNEKLAFNPNTNQLIIVPTTVQQPASPQLNFNGVELFAISNIQATSGDRFVGNTPDHSTFYATFRLLSNSAPLVTIPSSANALLSSVPVPTMSVASAAATRGAPSATKGVLPAVRVSPAVTRSRPAQSLHTVAPLLIKRADVHPGAGELHKLSKRSWGR